MPSETFARLPAPKRDRIVAEALKEFAERGYEHASLSAIVERLGIAKGSIYQYFEDKADLYRFLLEEALRAKRAFFAEETPTSIGLFEQLRWAFSRGAAFQRMHPLYARLGEQAALGASPIPTDMREASTTASTDALEQRIIAAQADGEVAAELDPRAAAAVLVTVMGSALAVTGGVIGSLEDMGTSEARDRFDSVLGVLLAGLAPRDTSALSDLEESSCE